jgi:hypothetical protein
MEGLEKVKEKAFSACETIHDLNGNLTALTRFLTPF